MRKILLLLLVLFVHGAPVMGAGVMNIDIYGPGQSRVNLFVSDPLSKDSVGPLGAIPGNAPMELQQRMHANCAFLPFFNMLSGKDIIGGPNPGGYVAQNIDFNKFQLSRTDVLVTAAWSPRPGGVGEVEGDRAGQTVDGPGAQGGRGGVDVGERTDRARAPHGAVRAGQHEHISR